MANNTSNSKMSKMKGQLVSSTLAKISRSELTNRDIFGRTILHLLILSNRYDLLRNLLKNPEAKVLLSLTDYENGWNCMHYVIFNKRLLCYKVLIDYLKGNLKGNTVAPNNNLLFELFRCKDRNRVTPLQLMDNDFKDLVWVPEYIDKESQYHLQYRFQVLKNTDEQENKEPAVDKKFLSQRSFVRHLNNWSNSKRGGSDIYMFGSNKNNNLGVGDATDRATPSRISDQCFRIKNYDVECMQEKLRKPRYRMIKISKNHSIVLTQEGNLYSCGIGSRGRLGHGFNNLNNTFRFEKIEFSESGEDNDYEIVNNEHKLVDVAISSNHSISLTSQNEVYSWGLNNYNQLGYSSSIASSSNSVSQKAFLEPFEGSPKEIISGDLRKNHNHIKGLSVSKIHSLVYTKNEIFFWGLCIGQMGISFDTTAVPVEYKVNNMPFKGFIQKSPKKITLRDDIKYVLTSDTCTCVITTTNDIHVYYQYQHFKLPRIPVKGSTDKHFDLFKPTKLTQAISIEKVCLRSHQFVALLLDNGDVMSFTLNQADSEESSSKGFRNLKYSSLWKSYDRDMKVVDMDVSNDGSIILCTRNGSAFIKTHSLHRKGSVSEASLSIPTVKNKFKRIENLNKIIKVTCDDNFLSFGFIRDDIDLIPFKLQSNDFFEDMGYLSCLSDANLFRKQAQLLSNNPKYNSYISDYLYPQKIKYNQSIDSSYHSILQGHSQDDEEDNDEIQFQELNSNNSATMHDLLYERHINKYNYQQNKRPKVLKTYLSIPRKDDEALMNLLKSDILYVSYKLNENFQSNKKYNCLIRFEKYPNISIKIHKELFITRSPFFAKIFNPSNPDEYFIEEGIKGRYDPKQNELVFTSDINIKSMLIMSHFIYTNKVLSIWDDFPGGLNCPKDIKEIKRDFDKLASLFLITDLWGKFSKDEVFLNKVRALLNNSEGDVVIRLSDGEIRCHSYILIARSAFFETILSDRWDNEFDSKNMKVLTLENISLYQFRIILRHLYGYNDIELFDSLETMDIDDFINCLLELIEISDELLLFNLKNLCQLAIKDFISLENVLILLTHAYNLDASKLFMNCCWYIYNNLEKILLDPLFKDIQDDLLKKLEKEILFFNSCKLIDFTDDKRQEKKLLQSWMEQESNSLIFKFLNNIKDYNEIFISDRKGFAGFEPLVDVKYDVRKATHEGSKRRKESSSHSTTTRKNSFISESQKNLIDFRKTATSRYNENENALDDSEDGFEVVNNKRRQNSKGENMRSNSSLNSTTPTPPPSRPVSRSSSVVDTHNIIPPRKPSFNSLYSAKPLSLSKESLVSGLSPHSNWANKSQEIPSSLAESQPILGQSFESSNELLSTLQKKNGKIKFGPTVRLSQKERKKMAGQILPDKNNSEEVSKISNPWSQSNTRNSIVGKANVVNAELPVLGKSKHGNEITSKPQSKSSTYSRSENGSRNRNSISKNGLSLPIANQLQPPSNSNSSYSSLAYNVNKPVNKVYSTPSLTEIMIHESLKVEESKSKVTEKKSLQEIQQEQQFAKWWEEEASKVQRQMSQLAVNQLNSPNPRKNRDSTSKGKNHRGQRPKSPPNRNNEGDGVLNISHSKQKKSANVSK